MLLFHLLVELIEFILRPHYVFFMVVQLLIKVFVELKILFCFVSLLQVLYFKFNVSIFPAFCLMDHFSSLLAQILNVFLQLNVFFSESSYLLIEIDE